jgi:subtilisin family serine protease
MKTTLTSKVLACSVVNLSRGFTTSLVLLFGAAALAVGPAAGAQRFGPETRFVPGELLVQFRAGASDADVLDVFGRAQLAGKRLILTPRMAADQHPGINLVTTRLEVEEAVRVLAGHPAVAFAEPNWLYRTQVNASDPLWVYLWGLNGPNGANAPLAWDLSTGSDGVCVGVVDQGFEPEHADLRGNVWLNPGDSTANGVNEDGNWYWYTYFWGTTVRVNCTDDLHGWDFLNQNNTIYDAWDSPTDLSDGDDHGTHVAGIIGAQANNGVGGVGVNWHVRLISAKFIGGGVGTLEDAIDAIDYMTYLKTRSSLPANIVAVNASWGGGGYSQALHDALIRLANAGILCVAAAGNGGDDQLADDLDLTPFYPACYDTAQGTSTQPAASYNAVLAVAAIDTLGQLARWSNYGLQKVHLGAPGVGICSTVPTDTVRDGYAYYSGTSMAAPHVTGAAALYASRFPGATAAQIRQAILGSTAPTAALAGKTVTGGRLDLAALLATEPAGPPPPPPPPPSPTAPAAPSGLTAKALSSSSIRLQWVDNSSNETGFNVERSLNGTSFSKLTDVGANATTHTDTGLARNTTYYYRVRAFNTAGSSAYAGPAKVRTRR